MDEPRFDQITRSLGAGSRRAALLGAAAAALGLGLAQPAGAGLARRKCRHIKDSHRRKACMQRWKEKLASVQVCSTDGECPTSQICDQEYHICETCPSGTTGCEGSCLDLSVCPANQQHVHCNNSDACICTRLADNNNSRFCAVSTTCDVACGPGNSCPNGQACVMTCCDGPGNAGLRCLPSCS